MREEKRLTPKKRMSKYSEDWIEKEFNNLGNFGKIYPFSRSVEGAGRYHHIHYGDIHTKSFGTIDNNSELPTIKVEGNFELAKPGDIVIADASEDYKDLGKSVVIDANTNMPIIAGLHTFKFTPNEYLCSLYYLYYSQTHIFKRFSYKTGTGISVFGMSKDNLGKMRLYVPTIEEQQKIGDFFKILDERIANQERKIAKVKALKAAYLTEMFPQEGETVPKRRFKGYEGGWTENKLGNIVELVGTGKSIFSSNLTNSIERPFAVLGSTSVIGYDSEFDYHGNFILTARVGANAGNLYTFSGKVKISDNTVFIKNDNLHFLYYLLNSYDLKLLSFGTGQPLIKSSELRELTVLVPNTIEEQQKIGKFFKNLDNQIETEEKKLDKLQKMKEAYLEEMFV